MRTIKVEDSLYSILECAARAEGLGLSALLRREIEPLVVGCRTPEESVTKRLMFQFPWEDGSPEPEWESPEECYEKHEPLRGNLFRPENPPPADTRPIRVLWDGHPFGLIEYDADEGCWKTDERLRRAFGVDINEELALREQQQADDADADDHRSLWKVMRAVENHVHSRTVMARKKKALLDAKHPNPVGLPPSPFKTTGE